MRRTRSRSISNSRNCECNCPTNEKSRCSDDFHVPDTIDELVKVGVPLADMEKDGIKWLHFGSALVTSGMVCLPHCKWIVFNGCVHSPVLLSCLQRVGSRLRHAHDAAASAGRRGRQVQRSAAHVLQDDVRYSLHSVQVPEQQSGRCGHLLAARRGEAFRREFITASRSSPIYRCPPPNTSR